MVIGYLKNITNRNERRKIEKQKIEIKEILKKKKE